MFDQETWRFINSFAPWLSAVGTLAAVIVSLYLARRSARLHARVSAVIMNLISPGQKLADSPEFLEIRVVNHGFRDVMIQGITWQLVGFRAQAFLVLPPVDPISTKLPAKLSYGEQAQFLFPTSTFSKDAKPLLSRLNSSRFPKLSLRRLRVGVFASTGQMFLAPLDARLQRWLHEQAKKISA